MTTPTSEEPYPPQLDVVQEAPAPFEDYVKVQITKPVGLEQLTEEINKAAKANVTLALSGPVQGNEAISESNPADLYVSPSKVGEDLVLKVVDKHSEVPDYDVPEAERKFREVLQKVIDDPTVELDDADVKPALHGLLIREANRVVPAIPAP